jgi:hypothetical protein
LVPVKTLFLSQPEKPLSDSSSPSLILNGNIYSVSTFCDAINLAGNKVLGALRHPVVPMGKINSTNLAVLCAFLESENGSGDEFFSPLYHYLDNFLLPYEHSNDLITNLRRRKGWWNTKHRRIITMSLLVRSAFAAPGQHNSPQGIIDKVYISAKDANNVSAKIFNLMRMNPSNYGKVIESMLNVKKSLIVAELQRRYNRSYDKLPVQSTCKLYWPDQTDFEELGKEDTIHILSPILSMSDQVDSLIDILYREKKAQSTGDNCCPEYHPSSFLPDQVSPKSFNQWYLTNRVIEEQQGTPFNTRVVELPKNYNSFNHDQLLQLVSRGNPPGNMISYE